jgi:predicted transposase/invertase (TIGR01784 family)
MAKEKYINPLTDFGFKKLFGTEPNKNLLINFLNELMPEKHKIVDLNYTKNDNKGQSELDRNAIFDLSCIAVSGERFIVEMQNSKQTYFKDRGLYYTTFPIQEQAQTGNWDFKLAPVYFIGILNFALITESKNLDIVQYVELKDQDNEIFYDKLKFMYIELEKFNKTEEELETNFDKWLFALTQLSKLDDIPEKLRNEMFEQLFKEAEIAKFTPKERQAYQDSLKAYRDNVNTLDYAKKTGEKIGIVKGKKIGARENTIETAITLINLGYSSEEILTIISSKLTIAEIEELRKKGKLD